MSLMQIVWALVKILIMVMFILNVAGILTWVDRRQSSMIQDRIGPNRAVISIFGKEIRLAGLLHTAADGMKFFTKEDFMPPKADKLLFMLAPMMALGMVFTLRRRHPLRRHHLSPRRFTSCRTSGTGTRPWRARRGLGAGFGTCCVDAKADYYPIDL